MSSDKMTIQTAIKTEWIDGGARKYGKEKVVDGYHEARSWQKEAFALLKDASHMILNAPMGSGKSWEICLISAYKMQENAQLRTIIAVPQDVIASGFRHADVILPCGRKLHWEPNHDLCKEKPDSTVEYVIDWLKNRHTNTNDRALICTHPTLLNVFRRLKEEKKLRLMKDLLIWVDEAHHIKNTKVAGTKATVFGNGIGELVAHACRRDSSTQIGLATATFFRGDRCTLLTDQMHDRFVRYNLPFDEHLKNMQHLRSFTYNFMMCGSNYVDAVKKVLKSHKGKYIVHIPRPGSRHATKQGKYHETEEIHKAFKSAYGGRLRATDIPGLTALKTADGELKILDLVDEKDRPEKKEFVASINESPDRLDAIVALGMFKEGADWIYADRSLIIGARASLVDVVQTMGRLFRDAPGKKHVEVTHMLPFSLDQSDKEAFREKLNDYLKAVYGSMILENVLDPVKIYVPSETDGGKGGGAVSTSELLTLVPDLAKQDAIMADISDKLMEMADDKNGALTTDDCMKPIVSILAKHKIDPSIHQKVAGCFLAMLLRRAVKTSNLNVKDIDFDILKSVNPINWIVDFTTKACGVSTLRDLRRAANGGVLYASYDRIKATLHRMRDEGRPINTMAEYREFVRTDGDYNAVLAMRSAG
jgi:hypothetical protein